MSCTVCASHGGPDSKIAYGKELRQHNMLPMLLLLLWLLDYSYCCSHVMRQDDGIAAGIAQDLPYCEGKTAVFTHESTPGLFLLSLIMPL